MKKKQFYSHIVDTDSLTRALLELGLKDDEHKHLEILIESTIHHEIIDAILSELSEGDKKIFLKHLSSEDNHEKVWEYLMDKVDSVEEKIKRAADDLKKELHKDIEETKKS
ncbi:MAG TPA: hypothetical protein PLD54_02285 [Candidatus Levybacteria bacterium]|nr:hypothetical protein [Candidatus Levybacteria bacterium]